MEISLRCSLAKMWRDGLVVSAIQIKQSGVECAGTSVATLSF